MASRLITPEKVRKLQRALYAKAKEEPQFRFYQLYDKLYREDILGHAYALCRANGGNPGVDGERFSDIEGNDRGRWLGELTQELRERRYRPQAVRRVTIPKPDGKTRPLGIPTIRDRVVQMAAVLILSPIFEVDFADEQYAYRPGRSAHDALNKIHRNLYQGYTEVVDADLSGYFDSIPHGELMQSVARRVSDRHILRMIKMWLEMPVEEEDNRGRRHRSARNRKEHRGTPQGAVISPLLANIYIRRFVMGWKRLGYEQRLQARIVNYADDFVIMCKGTAVEAARTMRVMMEQLKLTVNEEKTRVCCLPNERFDFLGYTIGRYWSVKTGRPIWSTRPSKKSVQKMTREITRQTSRQGGWMEAKDLAVRLNRQLTGWANYFKLGQVSPAYKAIDMHVRKRLRQWLCRKHKVEGRGTRRFPIEYLYGDMGVKSLASFQRNLPWAKAKRSCPRAGCGKSARPVR